MKRYSVLLLALLALIAAFYFLDCFGGTSTAWSGMLTGAQQKQDSDMCSLTCENFDGSVTYTIHVSEDKHRLNILGEVAPESGTLTVTIATEKGSVLYYGTATELTDIGVILPEYGVYQIFLEASDFAGSYKFTWKY